MDNEPNSQNGAIVRLVKLRKAFGGQRVLRNLSLNFDRSRTTVVLGPSGCGKSVMLKHILGLLKPDFGEVWFQDRRVDTLSERKLGSIRRQFGFLFQQSALFDSMTVEQNIGFPLEEHTKLTTEQKHQRIMSVLRMVGLADAAQKMPSDLSGGQRKRTALARAIVLQPKVILYDEPTTGLDPIRSDVINELILKLRRELDVTSVVVTHDLASAFKIADRLVMLYDGRVVMEGTPDEFRDSEVPIVQGFLQGEATAEELAEIHGTTPIASEQPDDGVR
jgi:phospholipid/cholesterol/gamma-HCH transport system ATP-binding protein